jgi:hypothetical protein
MRQGRSCDGEIELRKATERYLLPRMRQRQCDPTSLELNRLMTNTEDRVASLTVSEIGYLPNPSPPPKSRHEDNRPETMNGPEVAPSELQEAPSEAVLKAMRRSAAAARRGRTVIPTNVNRFENENAIFNRYTPEGGPVGGGMFAQRSGRMVALGAIFPIRGSTDIRFDGLCITSMTVEATPVKFTNDPSLRGVARYTVRLYTDLLRESAGLLDILPAARYASLDRQSGGAGKLSVTSYVAKVVKGSTWNIPGREELIVEDSDVLTAYNEPVWDRNLLSSVEATIYQIATRDDSMTATVAV